MSDPNIEHPAPRDDDAPESSPAAERTWRIAAWILVIAALASVGTLAWLMFAPDHSSPKAASRVRACVPVDSASAPPCPPRGARATIGLVNRTTRGGFTMRTISHGRLGPERTLHVRAPDRVYIDIAHARVHASLGQPIRVYTLRIAGRDSVVYMDDPPASALR